MSYIKEYRSILIIALLVVAVFSGCIGREEGTPKVTKDFNNYATAADFRSQTYKELVLQYESTGLKIPQDLVNKVITDALKSVASDAFIGWLKAGGYILNSVSIALDFKLLIGDANDIKGLLSNQYTIGTETILSSFDFESHYRVTTPQKEYPQEFTDFIKTGDYNNHIGGDLYTFRFDKGKQPDAITVELAYMSWLTRKEVEAWRAGNTKEAKKFISLENSFLSEHLSVWVPKFKEDADVTGNHPSDDNHPRLQANGGAGQKEYLLLIGKIDVFVQNDLKYVQKISTTKETGPVNTAATPIPTSISSQKIFTNSIGMEFMLIPAGEFDMGSEEFDWAKPVHRVKISNAFYIGKYEVTQKQWQEVMGNNPSYSKGDNWPVEPVSWNDAQEFVRKLNVREGTNKYRLPSEAEWEYAARAGTTTRYSFGDDESKLSEYAWYYDNSGSKTHEVGQKKPNPWGLYDVHGNVWEWVQDSWHDNYDGALTDGSAWEGDGSSRVGRGCGWWDPARDCRSVRRTRESPGSRLEGVGFRLVRIL